MSEQKPLTLSWMWSVDMGINALKINRERGLLEWYDEIGCACGDSTNTQTYADFLRKGATLDTLPDDVLEEVRETVERLLKDHA